MADDATYRPLRPGAQIAIPTPGGKQIGTIGCFVHPVIRWGSGGEIHQDFLTPRPCILTCFHVVKPPNVTPLNQNVHQPEPGGAGSVAGSFYVGAWDVALCMLGDRAVDQGWPPNDILGGVGQITGLGDPTDGATIRKYGRTTRATQGTCRIDNSYTCDGVVPDNVKCFRVIPAVGTDVFCDYGDSGAALVNDRGELVGILQSETRPQQSMPNYLCGIGMPARGVFQQLVKVIQETHGDKYPNKDYPNKQFDLLMRP